MSNDMMHGNQLTLAEDDETFNIQTYIDESNAYKLTVAEQSNSMSNEMMPHTDVIDNQYSDINPLHIGEESMMENHDSSEENANEDGKMDAYKLAHYYVKIERMSLREASKLCKIPKSTLSRYLAKGGPPVSLGRRPILLYDEYSKLTKYILDNPYKTPSELLRIFPEVKEVLTRKELESVKRNTLQRVKELCELVPDTK